MEECDSDFEREVEPHIGARVKVTSFRPGVRLNNGFSSGASTPELSETSEYEDDLPASVSGNKLQLEVVPEEETEKMFGTWSNRETT